MGIKIRNIKKYVFFINLLFCQYSRFRDISFSTIKYNKPNHLYRVRYNISYFYNNIYSLVSQKYTYKLLLLKLSSCLRATFNTKKIVRSRVFVCCLQHEQSLVVYERGGLSGAGGSERCGNRCDRGAGSARFGGAHHGRHTTGLLWKLLVEQSRGVAVCMGTGEAGGDGVT